MASLQVVDYVIFSVIVLLSFGIGLYYALRRKDNSTEEYLVAKRTMGFLPVSISLLVSFFSVISILGNSSEMYYFGAEYWFRIIGGAIGFALAPYTFIPLYHSLDLISVHKYLLLRYKVQWFVYIGTFLQCMMFCWINGAVLFGPATMVESMSGIPVWANIIVTGLIATLYTAIGGFKAVIWADVFQAAIIFLGLIVFNVLGTIEVGGMSEVWNIYKDNGRLDLNLSPSPLIRSTVWGFIIGFLFNTAQRTGVSQVAVQRFCSLPTMKDVKRAIFCTIPLDILIVSLTCLSGVVAFSYFTKQGCDPLKGGNIKNPNQVVPYFITKVINYTGIQGLFIACVFCGTLSNLSSFISSTSAIIWDDILNHKLKSKRFSERKKTLVTKSLCGAAGIVSTACAFVISNISGTLIQIAISIANATLAPITIMVVLGAVSKRSSWKSAFSGSLLGFIFLLWILIGNHLSGLPKKTLPTVTTNCGNTNSEALFNITQSPTYMDSSSIDVTAPYADDYTTPEIKPQDGRSHVFLLYRISYIWYPPLGIVLGIFIGLILSFIPGFANTELVDDKLLFPFMTSCCRNSKNDNDATIANHANGIVLNSISEKMET